MRLALGRHWASGTERGGEFLWGLHLHDRDNVEKIRAEQNTCIAARDQVEQEESLGYLIRRHGGKSGSEKKRWEC